MDGSCSLKALVGGVCGFSDKDRKRQTEIITAMRKLPITNLLTNLRVPEGISDHGKGKGTR